MGRGREMKKLTTQTPGTAYLPSAAFLSMMFALFWERSILGGLDAGSTMLGEAKRWRDILLLKRPSWQCRCQVELRVAADDRDYIIEKKRWFG